MRLDLIQPVGKRLMLAIENYMAQEGIDIPFAIDFGQWDPPELEGGGTAWVYPVHVVVRHAMDDGADDSEAFTGTSTANFPQPAEAVADFGVGTPEGIAHYLLVCLLGAELSLWKDWKHG